MPWPIPDFTLASQEWFWFYDLMTGDVFSKRRSTVADASIGLDIAMYYNTGDIKWIKWQDCNTDQVRYIGHKGVGVVGYQTTGVGNNNPFNPSTFGSNYYINDYNGF